jgi:MFS family permease
MLASFLTVARLSDYVGRKPMILAALLINAAALVLFITADSAAQLILARVVQGVATGIAIATLGAAILDTDKTHGALLNSVTAFIGLMLGSLLAGVLVAFAPLPGQLVYIVMLGVTLAEALVLAAMPETTAGKAGALRALKPRLSLPVAARPVLVKLLPLNVAGWALGGFYLSLMPTLVTVATGIASPFIGAAVVSALMLTAAVTVFTLRNLTAERMLLIAMLGLLTGIAVTMGAVYLQSVPLMIAGTVVAGVGFGMAYSGNLQTLLPLAGAHERAGLLATYFVESYIAFSVPAVIAGLLVPTLGLVTTTYYYGAVLIVLIVISLLATQQRQPRRQMEI